MVEAQPDFIILYGTQTNTAKAASEELGREATRRKLSAQIMEFDRFPIMQLPVTKLVVFVIATTGDGEAPTTMMNSWRFLLRRDLPQNSLKDVKFTVFGLGDSSYALFNAMAKKLAQRMLDLGATLFHKVGLGDYQHDFGYEGEFDPWMQQLWTELKLTLPPVHQMLLKSSEDIKILPPIYKVETVKGEDQDQQSTLEHLPQPHGAVNSQVYLAPMVANERLTAADHFQDTRKISLNTEKSQFQYKAGDVLMIMPQSRPELVKEFLDTIGLDPQQRLKITADTSTMGQVSQSSLIKFPEHSISALELFTWWLNISEPPSRYFCQIMGHFLKQDPDKQMQSEKLSHFASKTADGKSEYFSFCIRERRNMLEVFKDFGITTQVPLEYLIQGIGPQRPREFSISSAFDGKQIDLTVAITEFQTKFKRQITGVCSGWLAASTPPTVIPCWIKRGTMSFPKDKPLIFVGPGTGVAAFRAAIQEHKDQQLILLFGCRSEEADYYYKEDWKQMVQAGVNLKVITAFSRDTDSKVYVQHKIREHGPELAELIFEKDALIYVSGRAKFMPNSVEKAFTEIIRTAAGLEEDLAKQFVQQMKKEGRYQIEVW